MTRHSLSLPVLLVTAVAVPVLGGALYVTHQWQLERLSHGLINLASAAEDDEDWLTAAQHLDRFLRIKPNDAAASTRLALDFAKVAEKTGQHQRAIELSYRALAAGETSDTEELRLELASQLLQAGRDVECEQEARTVLKSQPKHPKAMRLLALSLFAQVNKGAIEKSQLRKWKVLGAVEAARKLNPRDVNVAEAAASLFHDNPGVVSVELPDLSEAERQSRARECLDDLIDATERHEPLAFIARYRYRLTHGIEGATEDLETALRLSPEAPQILLLAAEESLRRGTTAKAQGQDEEAAKHIETARSRYQSLVSARLLEKIPEPYLGLGDALSLLGKPSDAHAAWKLGVGRVQLPAEKIVLQLRIVDAFIESQKLTEASAHLDAVDKLLVDLDARVPRASRLALVQAQDLRRGTWLLLGDSPLQAIPHLQRASSTQNASGQQDPRLAFAFNHLGRAFAMLGEWGESATAFDRAAAIQPNSLAVRLAAAQAWLQAGRPDLAVDRIEFVLSIQPTFEAWYVLAAAELEQQCRIPKADRSWGRMLEAIQLLKTVDSAQGAKDLWRVNLLEVRYLMATKAEQMDHEKRLDRLVDESFGKFPKSAEYWSRLAPLLQQAGMEAQADKVLAFMREHDIDPIAAALASARVAGLRGDHAAAIQELEAALPRAPLIEKRRINQELINVSHAMGKPDKVKAIAQSILVTNSNDLAAWRTLAELSIGQKDFASVSACEQRLAQLGPPGVFWARYFKVLRLTMSASGPNDSKLDDALMEQTQLAGLRSQWPQLHVLRGMIEQRLNRLDAAAGAYEQAVRLGATDVGVYERLIPVLDRLNRAADVEKYLSLYEAQMPLSQQLAEIASSHLLKREPQKAIDVARKAVDDSPDDLEARIWLGRLLLVTSGDEKKEAEAQFRKSIELAPTDLRGWSGLFSYHLRMGNATDAEQTLLEMAEKANLASNERSFVLAQGYELIGNHDAAIRYYQDAARVSPKSAIIQMRLANALLQRDPALAKSHLRRAMALDPELAQARRMLAVVLASSGVEADLREAEQLLSVTQGGALNTVEDKRLQALLLAQQGGTKHVQRAVEILESVVEKNQGAIAGDRIVLAQLYEHQASRVAKSEEAKSKLKLARQQLLFLASSRTPQVAHLITFAEFLMRSDDVVDASIWAEKANSAVAVMANPDIELSSRLVTLQLRLQQFEQCEERIEQVEADGQNSVRAFGLRARLLHAQSKAAELDNLLTAKAEALHNSAGSAEKSSIVAKTIAETCANLQRHELAETWYRKMPGSATERSALVILSIARQHRTEEALDLCLSSGAMAETPRFAVLAASILADASATGSESTESFIASSLQKFPEDASLLYAVAMLRLVQKDYDKATELFRRVIKLNPRHVAAMNNLAMILAETPDQRDEAILVIDQAIQAEGEHPGLLDTKGAILVYQGKPREALPLLKIATRGDDVDPRHRFHLAAAYHQLGDDTEARLELEQALASKLEGTVLTHIDQILLKEIQASLLQPESTP